MGGPDPLAEEEPPPPEAIDAAEELRTWIVAAGEDRDPSAAESALLATTAEALGRYTAGERSAVDEVDPRALGGLLGAEGRAALDRWDAADHGLTPRELRRLGEVALAEIESAPSVRPGGHGGGPGHTGEPTGRSLPGDGLDRPLDAVATLRAAMVRRAARAGATSGDGGPPLHADDLRYTETEPTGAAVVCLLVDLSHSMVARGLHEAATRTALALHTLVRTRRPEDRVLVIGFGDRARTMTPAELVEHDWRRVPGTNLHHALHLARGYLRRHRGTRPLIMVVTDGEPTAHLGEDGDARFAWPPTPRTVELTTAELDAALAEGAEPTFFLLADDPRLRSFRDLVERRRGVRVVTADAQALGPLVIGHYLDGTDRPR
ncbi:VWA domain-containing protein [Nocardiopsis sp. MG754419]|uniref:VWA domain-containing protein n=1 Tax=Nocardiopsis sp. MG754419 TaxID=2259865 RepID=UPI0020133CF4|nr:VWA domain-containing protein [Nocardiopsis sp. MG754419]